MKIWHLSKRDKRWKYSTRKSEKKIQNKYKSCLNEIKRGKNKSNEQKSVLYNIETLYKSRKSVIKFFDDYFLMISGSKYKAIQQKSFFRLLK